MKKKSRESEYRLALLKIAAQGKGLKPEVIDWQSIGKNSVKQARDVVAGKCKCCGKQKDYL